MLCDRVGAARINTTIDDRQYDGTKARKSDRDCLQLRMTLEMLVDTFSYAPGDETSGILPVVDSDVELSQIWEVRQLAKNGAKTTTAATAGPVVTSTPLGIDVQADTRSCQANDFEIAKVFGELGRRSGVGCVRIVQHSAFDQVAEDCTIRDPDSTASSHTESVEEIHLHVKDVLSNILAHHVL